MKSNKKRTIVEAITEILRASGGPMTVAEIYDAIVGASLYKFNTDAPVHIVRTQIRRHCTGIEFASAHRVKYFQLLPNGKYDLISSVSIDVTLPKEVRGAVNNHTLKTLYLKYLDEFRKRAIEQIKALESEAFERFCRNLLEAYGFREVKVTRPTKDGGIDGFGQLKVGFAYFDVAFQCKRYTRGKRVGRPEVDQFRGAIQGEYQQGIFFTTSDFTLDAKSASLKAGAVPIILINGEIIVDVMIEHSFGIETEFLPLHTLALDLAIAED